MSLLSLSAFDLLKWSIYTSQKLRICKYILFIHLILVVVCCRKKNIILTAITIGVCTKIKTLKNTILQQRTIHLLTLEDITNNQTLRIWLLLFLRTNLVYSETTDIRRFHIFSCTNLGWFLIFVWTVSCII